MTFLSWRKDYAVGVAQIDAEHQSLFDLVNAFHEAHARGDSHKETAKVLNRLIAYAEVHFQHEEKLMSEGNYPRLEMHSALHSDFVSAVFAINEKLAADCAGASTEVLAFAKNWLVEHIIKNDIDVGSFLQRKSQLAKNKASDGADHDDMASAPAVKQLVAP